MMTRSTNIQFSEVQSAIIQHDNGGKYNIVMKGSTI
jgi:hypothetical protein